MTNSTNVIDAAHRFGSPPPTAPEWHAIGWFDCGEAARHGDAFKMPATVVMAATMVAAEDGVGRLYAYRDRHTDRELLVMMTRDDGASAWTLGCFEVTGSPPVWRALDAPAVILDEHARRAAPDPVHERRWGNGNLLENGE